MKTTAIIEVWDDRTISIYVPEFEGFNLNGQGRTVEEAKHSLLSAMEDYKRMFEADGKKVPALLSGVEFEYKYDIASFLEYFRFISASTFAECADVSPSLMQQYERRTAFASESQKVEIERAIHKVGKELISIHL